MSITRLANVDHDTFWAHHTWKDFADLAEKDRYVAVLPVFGLADHGLGLSLDAEEIVGSEVLRRAVEALGSNAKLRVLPPLRFVLGPYPSCHFSIDPETAHTVVAEIASGVKAAGFTRLVFFNTSPWNKEFVDAASIDARASLGLRTYVIHACRLGIDFHPASMKRAQAGAAVTSLTGKRPVVPTAAGDVADEAFRPGCYRRPAPLPADQHPFGVAAVIAAATSHLTRLLAEIGSHPPHATANAPAATTPPATEAPPSVFPDAYRARYLPALTPAELEHIPAKDKALVIVPTGSIEQHGHHLPVGVDAMLGQAWLERTLAKLPAAAPVYVAPPLTYGKSNEHTGFPGTLSLSALTLRRLLLATASHLKSLGFTQLAVLNTHGGNSAVLIYTIREIQATLGLRAGVLGWPYKPDLSPQEAAYGFHAGEFETSLMLAVASELVRMDKAVCEFPAQLSDPGELRPEDAAATFSWLTSDISRSGVMGDAIAATAEKGHRWIEAGSEALARRIESLLTR